MSNKNNVSTPPKGPMGAMGGGPGGRMMPGAKAKDFKGTLKKLLAYLGNYKWSILFVWVLAAGATILAIQGPKILGGATTEIFNGIMGQISGTSTGIDFGKIGEILWTLIIIYLISASLSYLQNFIMSGVSNKVTYRLRHDIDCKIHKLPFSYYDKTTNGEILSRITNDVDAINQSLNQSITQIITSIASIIGITWMMLSINPWMTLIAFLIIPITIMLVSQIIKRSQAYFRQQQVYLGKANGHIEEMYGAHVVVTAFNGQEQSKETFKGHNDGLYNASWKANFFSGLMMPITGFIGNMAYVGICVVGGYFASTGSISVGDIQAFIQYVRQFTQPINQLSQISNVLQQTMAAAERVFEFLDETEETADIKNALCVNNDPNKKDTDTCVSIASSVEFKDVSFGYNRDKLIIKNFSAKVKPGQRIAIVGPTGAGKTTVVKLLMRFYDVNKGAIFIDGHDIKDFQRSELRSLFGMVLQETWLYNDTIANNIRYGKLDATDEQVRAAAKHAQVDHFVRTLPRDYNMVLNEEANNVSQGQKQLLTIARAILADPKILILDEATSSVDTRTEALIQKAMANLLKGRTSFIIAHRLSTIKDADLILVMNNGDIVEQGTHDELLLQGGFYANLYNSQFERDIEE